MNANLQADSSAPAPSPLTPGAIREMYRRYGAEKKAKAAAAAAASESLTEKPTDADAIESQAAEPSAVKPESVAASESAVETATEPAVDAPASVAEPSGKEQQDDPAILALAAAREKHRAGAPAPSFFASPYQPASEAATPTQPPRYAPPSPMPGGGGPQAPASARPVTDAEIASFFDGDVDASRYAPLPSGEYFCIVKRGKRRRSTRDTLGFTVAFEILEGEFAGRHIFLDFWGTPGARAMRARELRALELTDASRLVENLPPLLVRVRVACRQNDDGRLFTAVCRDGLRVVGMANTSPVAPPRDPFDIDKTEGGGQ